ncbi:hypothetical protein RFI_02880 [Reticulomyxa filosa]|uniref:Uncharacterized protein n=1 Tax=Reticulomyxa filosa TaxID=46433 RepID=X6P6P9_RETFI|nr:hypothetical protein RFI_02880 [Reticulomyxa filosa]|eukprot:ETO34215.1 hypothetical protein RFI_02880 [Reticulomyxa filosa]
MFEFVSLNNLFEKTKLKKINKMGNRNTIHFQSLKELPTSLYQAQCVLHKHEILICGGYEQRACYFYHKVKNEYKFICECPSNFTLNGHCVVKLVDNNNKITLLSFGGYKGTKYTLMMKYVSVWNNISNKSKNLKR